MQPWSMRLVTADSLWKPGTQTAICKNRVYTYSGVGIIVKAFGLADILTDSKSIFSEIASLFKRDALG